MGEFHIDPAPVICLARGTNHRVVYARGRLGAGLALDSIASDWLTVLRQEQERRGCERHHRICFSRLLITLHRAGVTPGGTVVLIVNSVLEATLMSLARTASRACHHKRRLHARVK
jgi:hypothetical protein